MDASNPFSSKLMTLTPRGCLWTFSANLVLCAPAGKLSFLTKFHWVLSQCHFAVCRMKLQKKSPCQETGLGKVLNDTKLVLKDQDHSGSIWHHSDPWGRGSFLPLLTMTTVALTRTFDNWRELLRWPFLPLCLYFGSIAAVTVNP